MMQSIDYIYNPDIKVLRKTVASVKQQKATITSKRRQSIISAIREAGFLTVSMLVKILKKSQSTIGGDMVFLMNSGQVKSRYNTNPYPGKGKHGKQYFIPE